MVNRWKSSPKVTILGHHELKCCLGTPNNENWPGILNEQSPESKNFLERKVKNYSGDSWTAKAPRLDHHGRDLLTSLLKYQNCARISARGAMRHKVFEVSHGARGTKLTFFQPLGPNVHCLGDSESIFTLPHLRLSRLPTKNNRKESINRRRSHIFWNLFRKVSKTLWKFLHYPKTYTVLFYSFTHSLR